jgi:hypothetical protein
VEAIRLKDLETLDDLNQVLVEDTDRLVAAIEPTELVEDLGPSLCRSVARLKMTPRLCPGHFRLGLFPLNIFVPNSDAGSRSPVLTPMSIPKSTTPHIVAPATRLLYDRKSAALQLSISVRSLDYLIARQELATRRIASKVLIPHSELIRFARGHHTGPICGVSGDKAA